MQFGSTLGSACASFAVTNIDDLFVLVTFFVEASTSDTLAPLKITLGQYVGFTVIVIVSLIGFAVAQAIPPEPIGFLGLVPILLGVWKLLGLLIPGDEEEEDDVSKFASLKSVAKIASITVMNGGDNIGSYIPLFSQAKGTEIAVYVVTFYILLGLWCLAAFLIMREKHLLRVVQKYSCWLIPFLYTGLGMYIVIKSSCYPWSIRRINDSFRANPGTTIMAVITLGVLLTFIGIMLWVRVKQRPAQTTTDGETVLEETHTAKADNNDAGNRSPNTRISTVDVTCNEATTIHDIEIAGFDSRASVKAPIQNLEKSDGLGKPE
ncbi:cadmium resistance transporter domain-containing protein [Trichoderma chlorosporum]